MKANVKLKRMNVQEKFYYLIQKLVGVLIFIIGYASIPLSDGDGTAFVFLLMFALPLMFSKDKIFMSSIDNYEEDNDEQ